ncbi:HpcH/HpaI aldolase family protein [Aneurinibacillus tyrosinisolvens]|uniref:HpcH/HpaI aldolase family protein n=1 Tax=Aneurinibacillus tyrosinisolvens TaxID=1443435 RepID=UPI00063FBB95|nr:aldolase/citrate lyase family protein [Aneurinibacillus tyrosinisolvens]
MFKSIIKNGKDVVGIWQRIPSPIVSEVLSLTGVDFVTVDMEHGPVDLSDLRAIVPVYKKAGIPVILRVASGTSMFISKVLDLGVDGVMLPQVNNVQEARAIVEASKFGPLGKRGVGGACAADHYGDMNIKDFVQSENDRVITIVQIETEQAIRNLDEIIGVEGVDLFYIGPMDLSQSLGLTGMLDHPVVIETIQKIIDKVKERGKSIGMHGTSVDFINFWRERGVHYFTHGIDSVFLKQGVRDAYKSVRLP